MKEAEAIIGHEATVSPSFMERLHQALREAPLYVQQIALPLDGLDEVPVQKKDSRIPMPPLSRPKSAALPANRLRMEIWRKSKHGQKNVKFIEL
jgi:hypothetical protein